MYSLIIKPEIDKIFNKLGKKNPKQLKIIFKKIRQILENPFHFKPLRGDMYGERRVRISKSFVLTYEIIEQDKIVRVLDYDHHDNIYKKKHRFI